MTMDIQSSYLGFIRINQALNSEEWVVGLVVVNHNHVLVTPTK